MKRSLLAASAGLLISKKGNSELLNAADGDRAAPFTAIPVISLIAALGVLASLTVHAEDDQMGGPGQKADSGQTQNWPAGPAIKDSISGQLGDLTSRISRLEIAMRHMHPADSSMGHEMQ